MLKITYYGHDAFLFNDGKTTVAIDPFITGNKHAKIKARDLRVEYILITHGHSDHIGDGIDIAKGCNATIIASYELACYLEKKGCKTHPMHLGGSFNFPFGRVKLTIAHHGSGIIEDNNIIYGGNPCGFLLTMDNKTIYHAGDTSLFGDMRLIGEQNRIDAALLPIGDNFTMGISDAIVAADMLNAKLTIPMHYNTFDIINTSPERFIKELGKRGKDGKIINFGESIEL